jgi:hypothetical protein
LKLLPHQRLSDMVKAVRKLSAIESVARG